ncbi:hypothetical protein FIU94_18270 (plasmid) [Sulfitobacter sp. THAF37]|nr:hypothetical protein FIU94_18270 [Sulfitobacter sp. THAF37]
MADEKTANVAAGCAAGQGRPRPVAAVTCVFQVLSVRASPVEGSEQGDNLAKKDTCRIGDAAV